MSTRVHQTALGAGWVQIFPAEVERLNDLLRCFSFCGSILQEAAGQLSNYKGADNPKTEDGYSWFWALYFHLPIGELAVLIPWAQDTGMDDGSRSDRSANVYIKGDFSLMAMDDVVSETQETMAGLCNAIEMTLLQESVELVPWMEIEISVIVLPGLMILSCRSTSGTDLVL